MIEVPLAAKEQLSMFQIDAESLQDPGALHLVVRFHKVPRRRCSSCGTRRVCYYMGIGDIAASAPLCARCQGFR